MGGYFLIGKKGGMETMEFKLFKKLGSLEGMEFYLLLGAAAVFITLLIAALAYRKKAAANVPAREKPRATRALVYGAMSITLAFVLSYFKLFSMPFGGSITLFSMLPLFLYAAAFGPGYGFLAAFAYALLQVVQGAYIVHPVQFVLDYFVAFTCLGLASFFPRSLPLGAAVGGLARMLVSLVSGAVFFRDSGLDYGIANAWVYSLVYNASTIGVDTLLCVIVAALPPIRRLAARVFGVKAA